MADYTVKRIDDMEAIFRGGFRKARAELGVKSFGVQILEFPPDADQYPEHDHASDGQEEVYLLLRGSAEIDVAGERFQLDPETMVRVGPGTMRKIYSGGDGARILALGGVPGKVYEPASFTELGEPDPFAA